MKIYTKKGDKGQTSLIGGKRVAKHHIRIEAYGTVDELNSYIGLLLCFKNDSANKKVLSEIQDRLFTIGSLLASAPGSKMMVPDLIQSDVEMIENSIDRMNEKLSPLKSFILPGGNEQIAHIHIARCVCRRAERLIVKVNLKEPLEPLIIEYINRLSDYLFTLARFAAYQSKTSEIEWRPRK